MRAYIQQRRPLPDFLLLRTVDLVLDHTAKSLADPRCGGRSATPIIPS